MEAPQTEQPKAKEKDPENTVVNIEVDKSVLGHNTKE
jgi:hypothetical protein